MSEEKRMVDAFEVKHAIHIGDKEVLFGVDDSNTECPYMVCYCTRNNPFGIDQFSDGTGSADYLEMMGEFLSRVAAQIEAVKAEREAIALPLKPFTAEHCAPNDYQEGIEGKVVAINPEHLRPEYRTANNQLVLVTGGFGASANARERAVFTINLYSGEEARWNREDILGVVKPLDMPEWAKKRFIEIKERRQAEKKRSQPER